MIGPGSVKAHPQPTIELDGLLLRPWRLEDTPTLVRAYSDPEIRRWHFKSMDDGEARQWMCERHDMWQQEAGGDWLVLDGGTPAGRVTVYGLDLAEARGEVGYWVLPEARGRGVATRALEALSDWLFAELGLWRLELGHSTANNASCRVALKAGFAPEGIARCSLLHQDGWHDVHLHARLRDDVLAGCGDRPLDELADEHR